MSAEGTPVTPPAEPSPAGPALVANPAYMQPPQSVAPAPTAPNAPNPMLAPAPPAPPVVGPNVVPLPMDKFEALLAAQARLAEYESEKTRIQREKDDEKARHMAAQGKWQEGMDQLKSTHQSELQQAQAALAAYQERAKNYALEGELAREMANYPIVNAKAAEMLANQFRSQLTVDVDGSTFKVRTPTYQSVKEYLAGEFGKAEYHPFLRAQQPQAPAPVAPAHSSATTPIASPVAPQELPAQPKNMGEAAILHFQAQEKANPTANAKFNMNQSFGIGLKRG